MGQVRTFFFRRVLDVSDDVSCDQAANVECAHQVDPHDLLKDVQGLRLTIPEYNLK